MQAAPSRLLTWGLPSLLVVLLAAALVGRFGLGSPIDWAQGQVNGGLRVINNVAITPVRSDDSTGTSEGTPTNGSLVALRPLAPAMEQTPEAVGAAEAPAEAVSDGENADEESTNSDATGDEAAQETIAESSAAVDEEAESTEVSAADQIATNAVSPSAADPVSTVTPTPTAEATDPATSTRAPDDAVSAAALSDEPSLSTATPTPTAENVDTATDEETGVERSVAADEDTDESTRTPTATPTEDLSAELRATVEAAKAERTLSPTPTSTPTPTSIPMASYTVRSGDTLVGIAERYDISVDALLDANGISSREAANLQVGQVLLLPGVASSSNGQTQTYVVQSGDTLVGIALRFSVSTESLLRTNGLTESEARNLQVGQTLLIPSTTAASNAASVDAVSTPIRPTASPTPEPIQYTVRSGDTPVDIAQRYGVTTQNLLAFNDLTDAQARTIQPGDVLLIPRPGQELPTATPTAPPQPTPTPDPAAAYRLDAPQLLQPVDGVTVQCDSSTKYMQWQQVNGMAPDDQYVLVLGYVDGPADDAGEEPVTWVLRQETEQRNHWRMDSEYCNLAPQSFGRRWKWYVQIFEDTTAVSPPSTVREFVWR